MVRSEGDLKKSEDQWGRVFDALGHIPAREEPAPHYLRHLHNIPGPKLTDMFANYRIRGETRPFKTAARIFLVCDDDHLSNDDDLSVSVASSSEDKPGPSGLSGSSTSNSQESVSVIPETLKDTYKDILFAMANKRVVQKTLWEQHEEAKCRFAPSDSHARVED